MWNAAVIFMLLGMGVLLLHRYIAKTNFFYKRAPQIKISDLQSFDSTWISGIIEAPKVLVPPIFNYETVFYNYELFEERIGVKTDKNGRTTKTRRWERIHSKSEFCPFYINDGSGKILVNPAQAIKSCIHEEVKHAHRWKHTISYFPASGSVSSVGIASENRDQLIAKGETPLMLTLLNRKQFMQGITKDERNSKYAGLTLMWLSLTFAAMAVLEHYKAPPSSGIKTFILGGLLGLIPFAGIYYYFTFNTFVNLRKGLINSWANMDVLLKARRDSIPNLASCLEDYFPHEKNAFTAILSHFDATTNKRSLASRIQTENEISKHIEKVLISIEKSPELKVGPVEFLSAKLKVIEDKIAQSRCHFNDFAEGYNTLCQKFPSKLISTIHRFEAVPFYGNHNDSAASATSATSRQRLLNPIDENSLMSLPPNIAQAMGAQKDNPEKKTI